jgi:tripartite ATP-independent transporter DctM subunit
VNALLGRLDAHSVTATRRVALIGVLGMLFIAIATIMDVLLRWALNAPITGLNEIVEMGIAVAIAATFPAGAAQRVNLAVDVFASQWGEVVVGWLKFAGAALLLIFFTLLGWRMGVLAVELKEATTTTMYFEWPLYPSVWAITVLLCATVITQAIATTVALRDAMNGEGGDSGGHGPSASDAGAAAAGIAATGRSISDALLLGLTITLFVLSTLLVFIANEGVLIFGASAQAIPGTMAITLFIVMWVMVLSIVPLGAAMGLMGLLGTSLLLGAEPALTVLATEVESFLTNSQLAVLPLFLMMGSFAGAAGLSGDIYNLAHVSLSHRRGGLALATIGGCAGFGALTGSSLATAATIGQIALPEMRSRGYSPGLATGCVAAGGTLGQLVPPSTVIILYAILTEESIGQLFIAAIIPALLAVVLYWMTIAIYVRVVPDAAPPAGEKARWTDIWIAVRRAWGVLLIFLLVIGGLYGGVFTATEAASVGAFGAFLFALFRGKLKGDRLWHVMGETTRTTAMIYILIFGAVNFSFFIGVSGLPELLTTFVDFLQFPPLGIVAILLVGYIILGSIMDPFPVMVITVPIVAPLIGDMGYSLVWWGIIMVVVVETGLITPPFGINVFVLKGISGGDVPMWTVFKGVLPFVAADFVKLALLTVFPFLILWLPATMLD